MIKLDSWSQLIRHFQGCEKRKQHHVHWACKLWEEFHFELTYRNSQVFCFPCLKYILLVWGRENWDHFSNWSQVEWKADTMVRFPQFVVGMSSPLTGSKNDYVEDILWSRKTPIFATSSNRIRKYDGGVLNDIEMVTMQKRWKYTEFSKPIQLPREIKPCPQCFANFIFSWDVNLNILKLGNRLSLEFFETQNFNISYCVNHSNSKPKYLFLFEYIVYKGKRHRILYASWLFGCISYLYSLLNKYIFSV